MTKRAFLTTLLGTAGILAAASQFRHRRSHMSMNADTSPITVRLVDSTGAVTDPIAVPRVVKSEDAWRVQLTAEQFQVTRTHGTERAFCGIFHDNHKKGLYSSARNLLSRPPHRKRSDGDGRRGVRGSDFPRSFVKEVVWRPLDGK